MKSETKSSKKSGNLKIYIASPYGFSEAGRNFYYNKFIPAVLSAGKRIKNDGPMQTIGNWFEILDTWEINKGIKNSKKIGENNRNAIDVSDGLIAVLDGIDIDSGVASEIGYAYAKGKKIIGYRGYSKTIPNIPSISINIQVGYFIRESKINKLCNTTDVRWIATNLKELGNLLVKHFIPKT